MAEYFYEGHFNASRITDSIQNVLNESRTFNRWSSRTSVFISHKHDDLNEISGFIGFLRNLGVDTYIDAFDPTLPNYTCGETAKRIKERIQQCDRFMFLATDNAIASKWCNWELGIGDVHKYKDKIAIVPIKNWDRTSYTGSEYLEIYPYLVVSNGAYFIKDVTTSSFYPKMTPLRTWLQK